MSKSEPLEVIGIGNALVDILAEVEDSFLEQAGLAKGAMTLIDGDQSDALRKQLSEKAALTSGGSAGNTMAGFAAMGGHGGYLGKLGADKYGDAFLADLNKLGLACGQAPRHESLGTGSCLVMTTPDAQRTMATCLGAATEFSTADLDVEMIKTSKIAYLEGYLFDPPPAKQAFRAAADLSKNSGNLVALTLSDRFCVDRHQQDFHDLVKGPVDILFANEDEASVLFATSGLQEICDSLRSLCSISLITRAEKGALVITESQVIEIEAIPPVQLVDSNGAGDAFAAGFLFGYTRKAPLAAAARLGSAVASEVISHFGGRAQTDLKTLVTRYLS